MEAEITNRIYGVLWEEKEGLEEGGGRKREEGKEATLGWREEVNEENHFHQLAASVPPKGSWRDVVGQGLQA